MAREGEGANAPQADEQGLDLIGLLFTRLENAAMNIGRTQMAGQYAAQAAAKEIAEVKANAELQQDYLLERLKQCQDAAALRSSGADKDYDFLNAPDIDLDSEVSFEDDLNAASQDELERLDEL